MRRETSGDGRERELATGPPVSHGAAICHHRGCERLPRSHRRPAAHRLGSARRQGNGGRGMEARSAGGAPRLRCQPRARRWSSRPRAQILSTFRMHPRVPHRRSWAARCGPVSRRTPASPRARASAGGPAPQRQRRRRRRAAATTSSASGAPPVGSVAQPQPPSPAWASGPSPVVVSLSAAVAVARSSALVGSRRRRRCRRRWCRRCCSSGWSPRDTDLTAGRDG